MFFLCPRNILPGHIKIAPPICPSISLPYQDDVPREGTTPLSQRSRSYLQFLCLYACFRVRALISFALNDFKIIWHKCLAYQDDVSCERTTPLFQRSRSHRQSKYKHPTIHVRSVIHYAWKDLK